MFCRKCGSQIADDSAFCYKCGERLDTDSNIVKSSNLNPDKLSTAETAEYLKMVCCLENDKFALERTRAELIYKVQTYGIKKNIYKPENVESLFAWDSYSWLLFWGAFLGYIGGAIAITKLYTNGIISALIFGFLSYETWLGIGIGIAVGLIIIAIIAILHKVSAAEESSIKKKNYLNEVASDNARVERERKCIPVFLAHIDEIDSKVTMLQNSLDKLYSYDILFHKYQGKLAPLNTMYEYFVSGRVTSLTAKKWT